MQQTNTDITVQANATAVANKSTIAAPAPKPVPPVVVKPIKAENMTQAAPNKPAP